MPRGEVAKTEENVSVQHDAGRERDRLTSIERRGRAALHETGVNELVLIVDLLQRGEQKLLPDRVCRIRSRDPARLRSLWSSEAAYRRRDERSAASYRSIAGSGAERDTSRSRKGLDDSDTALGLLEESWTNPSRSKCRRREASCGLCRPAMERGERGYVAMNNGDVFGTFGEPGFHICADFNEQTESWSRITGEVVIHHLDDMKEKIKHGHGKDRCRTFLPPG